MHFGKPNVESRLKMKTHNFILGPCDTDSISFCKPDMSPFSKEEQDGLLEEINSYMPKLVRFAHDGYYKTIVALKAKNYVLLTEDGKIKYKGSAIRDSKREPAIREFLEEIVKAILYGTGDFDKIYPKYIKEIMNIKDISRWSSRKTLTSKVLDPQRTNEQKFLDALVDSEYSEGDKVYVFYLPDESLALKENFKGEYNKEILLQKLFKSAKIFEGVMDIKTVFLNYKLKRNKDALRGVVNDI